MTHWTNVPLDKHPIGQMSHWTNEPLDKCPIGQMGHWTNGHWTNDHWTNDHWTNGHWTNVVAQIRSIKLWLLSHIHIKGYVFDSD